MNNTVKNSERSADELWSERKPSHTETAFVDETAPFVDDLERDINEVRAISEASAVSMMEALKQ